MFAADLMICNGEFALCAASASVPTGKTIRVEGKEFQEGMAVCPVLTGKAVANGKLMQGSCKAPAGKVWSLFSTVTEYPQAPSWAVVPMTPRSFVTKESFENAVASVAATGGSTNAVLHLVAIATLLMGLGALGAGERNRRLAALPVRPRR